MMHCDLRVRWKVASDLRFRAAISEPKTPSFCGISGDLAPSTRKSLAIAIVRFWCGGCFQNFHLVVFVVSLGRRNRAIVIAESLASVIAAFRITSVCWRSQHRIFVLVEGLRSLHCDSNRAIGVRWCSIRSTWNCGIACESRLRSLNASDWRFCPSKVISVVFVVPRNTGIYNT